MNIAVLGAGAWGTALALTFATQHRVTLWARDAQHIETLRLSGANARYLPGFQLHSNIVCCSDLGKAVGDAQCIIVVVPTAGVRALFNDLSPHITGTPVIWASKGFEPGGARLLHQVAAESLAPSIPRGVLSGPSFAQEVARGLPCALTLAAYDGEFAHQAATWLRTPTLRVYSNTDVIGVELGGAVKNVMAIAAGICDGMGYGYNARAALITRGLAEITRLGLALGGKLETFMGLTGVGDLLLTCTGDLSRNRQVGMQLARGLGLHQILKELGHTAEGVHTCAEVLRMADIVGVEMPISRAVQNVMFDNLAPRTAMEQLLSREPKAEYRA